MLLYMHSYAFLFLFPCVHCSHFSPTLQVLCLQDFIRIRVNFQHSFFGVLFARPGTNACMSQGTGNSEMSLTIPLKEPGASQCGVVQANNFILIILDVRYHAIVETSRDKSFLIQCLAQNAANSSRENSPSRIASLALTDNGAPVYDAMAGKVYSVEIRLPTDSNYQVSSCLAFSGSHQIKYVLLTDAIGCPLDKTISQFVPDYGNKIARATMEIFRFNDSHELHLQCVIRKCNDDACRQSICSSRRRDAAILAPKGMSTGHEEIMSSTSLLVRDPTSIIEIVQRRQCDFIKEKRLIVLSITLTFLIILSILSCTLTIYNCPLKKIILKLEENDSIVMPTIQEPSEYAKSTVRRRKRKRVNQNLAHNIQIISVPPSVQSANSPAASTLRSVRGNDRTSTPTVPTQNRLSLVSAASDIPLIITTGLEIEPFYEETPGSANPAFPPPIPDERQAILNDFYETPKNSSPDFCTETRTNLEEPLYQSVPNLSESTMMSTPVASTLRPCNASNHQDIFGLVSEEPVYNIGVATSTLDRPERSQFTFRPPSYRRPSFRKATGTYGDTLEKPLPPPRTLLTFNPRDSECSQPIKLTRVVQPLPSQPQQLTTHLSYRKHRTRQSGKKFVAMHQRAQRHLQQNTKPRKSVVSSTAGSSTSSLTRQPQLFYNSLPMSSQSSGCSTLPRLPRGDVPPPPSRVQATNFVSKSGFASETLPSTSSSAFSKAETCIFSQLNVDILQANPMGASNGPPPTTSNFDNILNFGPVKEYFGPSRTSDNFFPCGNKDYFSSESKGRQSVASSHSGSKSNTLKRCKM